MSTLILRDATLALCGAPESRGDRGEHLVERVREVQAMEVSVVKQFLNLLMDANALGEEADLELLSGLMIVGIAHPELASTRGFTGLATGRRVATRLEQDGDSDGALQILEELRAMYPEHRALERDYDAVLGRLGMVLNLADRYYDRAQQLLAAGEIDEGINWLREVLLLDSSRKDVARQIRDLRLSCQRLKPRVKVRWSLVVLGICMPLAMTGVVLREQGLRETYDHLPTALVGDLESNQVRLDALNQFFKQNPIWHGAIAIELERTNLRLEVSRLRVIEEERQAERSFELQEKSTKANQARESGRESVRQGRLREALSQLELALQEAPKDWGYRAKTMEDIDVLRKHLADQDQVEDSQ